MTDSRLACCTVVALLAFLWLPGEVTETQRDGDQKPSLSLRATPPLGFSPLSVRLVVELRDGSDNYRDFYCPTVEWDWGDGTVSESTSDCEPYQAGKSTIRRRYTNTRVYRQSGNYRITFRLKQKTDVVGLASAAIQVRAGAGEGRVR